VEGVKNDYLINGAVTTIYLVHKGKRIETIISTSDLERAMEYPNTWYPQWRPHTKSFIGIGNQQKDDVIKRFKLHRWLINAPEGMVVDHINRNTLDNRRENLRVISNAQNQQNRVAQRNSKSGIRGVCWNNTHKKWQAYYKLNMKFNYVGLYEDIKEAEQAVRKARAKHMPYSEEARTKIL
jgi:hypothetical protein